VCGRPVSRIRSATASTRDRMPRHAAVLLDLGDLNKLAT
jgi:hypothetical protein